MNILYLFAFDLELQYFLARRLKKNQMHISLLLTCIIFCIGESKRFDRKFILDDDTTVRFHTFSIIFLGDSYVGDSVTLMTL